MSSVGGFNLGFDAGFAGGGASVGAPGQRKKSQHFPPRRDPEEWRRHVAAVEAQMERQRQEREQARIKTKTRRVPEMSPERARVLRPKKPERYEAVVYRKPERKQ